jgi:hypothetical protein
MNPKASLDSKGRPIFYEEIYIGFEIQIYIQGDLHGYHVHEDLGESYAVIATAWPSNVSFATCLKFARKAAENASPELDARLLHPDDF